MVSHSARYNLFSNPPRGVREGGTRMPRSDIERYSSQALDYRPDIDGLRAIAVIAVVGFHAFPQYVPGGFVGVDVFFVLSGFLISTIIFKNLSRSDFSLSDFYARRARRILPALCLVLSICLLFGYYALLPDEFTILGKHTVAAAGFAANFAFWRDSGYFATAAEFHPLLHLWSLGIEEQFYLLWPLLLMLVWRYRFNIQLIVGLITAASLALNLVLFDSHPTANFYFPLSRFWELGLGCLLAAVKAARDRQKTQTHPGMFFSFPPSIRIMAAQLPVIGVALIAAAVFFFDSHTAFPGIAALIPTVGAMCVIAAPASSWFKDKMLAARALVYVGMISYPLYLWHWPILSFAAILHSGPPQTIFRVAEVLLSVALAVLTYQFIELPIRTQRRVGVSIGLGAGIAMLGLLGFSVFAHKGFAGRFDTGVLAMRQGPKLDSLCIASIPEPYRFNYCRRTNPNAPEVVFLGDSQAQGVYEGTVSMLGENQSMLLLAHGGCPPVLNVDPIPGLYHTDAARRSCNDTWTKFVKYVRATKPHLVVLVGAGAGFFERPGEVPSANVAQADARAFKEGTTALVAKLQRYSRVIYVLEIPTFDSAPACFLRPIKLPGENCSPIIARSTLMSRRSGYRASVREVQWENPSLIVFDPIPFLCEARACSQISGSGTVLYSDDIHLSPAGGRQFVRDSGLARFLADAMRQSNRNPISNTGRRP
jgi:peptidoglycan/LPS O-acetylase OafA/YrhL